MDSKIIFFSFLVLYIDKKNHINKKVWKIIQISGTIGACRAYFELNQGILCGEPTSMGNGINNFVLNFGESTSIHNTQFTTPNAEGWYTLDGRKLSGVPTQKGIYINNGKKMVIKYFISMVSNMIITQLIWSQSIINYL